MSKFCHNISDLTNSDRNFLCFQSFDVISCICPVREIAKKNMFWNGSLELWRREMGDVLGSKNLNNLLRRIRWDFYQTNKFICDVNSQDHRSVFNKDLLLLKPATDLWPSFAAPAGKSISGFLLFPLDWQNSPNKPKITLIECLKFLGLDWFADVS